MKTQCSHVFRSGSLHPSITIGGGHSLGQCPNEALPEFVVCLEHANKEALWYQIKHLTKKLEDAKSAKPVRKSKAKQNTIRHN